MIQNLAADVQAFTSNVFLVAGDEEDDSGEPRIVLVDPGNDFDVVSRINSVIGGLDAVILTHTHPDHIGNLEAVVDAFDVGVWGYDTCSEFVDYGIADEEVLEFGGHDYRALHTPGHKDDHLCFLRSDGEVLFAGDLVFANGGLWASQQNTVIHDGPHLNHDRLEEHHRASTEVAV